MNSLFESRVRNCGGEGSLVPVIPVIRGDDGDDTLGDVRVRKERFGLEC